LRPGIELSFAYYLIKYVGLNHLKDGTSNPSLSRDTFGAQAFPLPPPPQQQRIVAILKALDDKIELNRQMNETLEAMARALFKSWFVDFDPVRAKMAGRTPFGMDATTAALFPAALESTGTGLLPSGWGPVRLGDVFALKRGYDLPTSERMPGSVRIVSSSGPSGYHSDAKVRGPGVVTGRYGTIGNVYFIWNDFWPLNTALYVHDFKGTDIYYAFYLLTGLDFNKFSDKGAVPGVNRNDLHEEPVCRASTALQRAFADRVSPWLSLARANEDQSRTLAELRDLLLPKLLSGELRIREAEKAVEAAL
jgi:type I restriction enzyme S subunit